MKNVVKVLRFIGYVIIMHLVVTWLSNRVFAEVQEIPRGINEWFSHGLWYWIWHDYRYMYMLQLSFATIIISVAYNYILKISHFTKTTQIFTYIHTGINILVLLVTGIVNINSTEYSIGVQIMSIVEAVLLIGFIFVPIIAVTIQYSDDE